VAKLRLEWVAGFIGMCMRHIAPKICSRAQNRPCLNVVGNSAQKKIGIRNKTMNIMQFITPLVDIIHRKFTATAKSKYKIGKYEIEIPPNFALPNFQLSFKLYDRFLPVLAKNINSDKVIIDVGANIGDTVIALIQNCKNPIICVEPSDIFFPYLENNLKRISSVDFSRVKTIKKYVGTGLISGTLNHIEAGTASLKVIESSNSITHIALDKLVDDVSNVLLLKVDTDGFDFDVIKSAEEILSKSKPILFWENEISEDFQYKGFDELYSMLEIKGYNYIYIFDNFGNLITEETNFETLKNINSYLYGMKKHNCTRTFYYTDVLASTERNQILVKKAINEYKMEWINK
jgi:FkbM family methyltransferase